ncbi:MAG: pilus assembly protein TadG-related protein [Acidobacteria bacterium]|nr:pilus assembly protein TadG-related protein [Acidobacteriota bacterium]
MNSSSVSRQSRRKGERGSVLAVSAIGMMAFLLATGLTIDISHFYLVRTELQNAADAAALAGASALNGDDGGVTKAVAFARQELNKYGFNKQALQIKSENVLFSRNLNGSYVGEAAAKLDAKNIRFVKVSIPPKAVTTTFAAPVLGPSRNIAAEATAGMSVPLNNFCDYIPVTAIDADAVLFVPGNTYTIRRPPGGAVSPGNYQILAIDGSGASDDRIGLGKGVRNCVGAGSYVQTKPGVSAGAVRQGLNTRFGEYGVGLDPSEYPPDENVQENITYQQYLDAQQARDLGAGPAGGSFQSPPRGTGVRNRRVVLVPIIKESEFNNGRDSVLIDRFAAFFLQTKVTGGNGGDIKVEYIGLRTVLGRGGYDPTGGTPSNELTIPVLYK